MAGYMKVGTTLLIDGANLDEQLIVLEKYEREQLNNDSATVEHLVARTFNLQRDLGQRIDAAKAAIGYLVQWQSVLEIRRHLTRLCASHRAVNECDGGTTDGEANK